jgi:hypothetical protein
MDDIRCQQREGFSGNHGAGIISERVSKISLTGSFRWERWNPDKES